MGGPNEEGVVVAQVLAHEELGPIGKDNVVLGEALVCGPWGGDYDGGLAAQLEGEDRAVALGER